MASTTEDTQIHRSVLLDHKMVIEGVLYHEKKELQRFFNEEHGVRSIFCTLTEKSTLSIMRSIGDRTYKVNLKIVDGKSKVTTIETTLAKDQVADFKKNWKNNWHPIRKTGNWHPIGE